MLIPLGVLPNISLSLLPGNPQTFRGEFRMNREAANQALGLGYKDVDCWVQQQDGAFQQKRADWERYEHGEDVFVLSTPGFHGMQIACGIKNEANLGFELYLQEPGMNTFLQ